MPKTIQIRNVPDRLHQELFKRAKTAGLTLSDYIRALLEREANRPPAAGVFDRIAQRPKVKLGRSAADLLREERQERRG
jgi:hypothetical protein